MRVRAPRPISARRSLVEPGADGPFTEVDAEPVVFVALVAVEAIDPQIARVVAANGGVEVEIAVLSDQRVLR